MDITILPTAIFKNTETNMAKERTLWFCHSLVRYANYLEKVSSSHSIKTRFLLWAFHTAVIWILLSLLCCFVLTFNTKTESILEALVFKGFLGQLGLCWELDRICPVWLYSILALLVFGSYKWVKNGSGCGFVFSTVPWTGLSVFFTVPLIRFYPDIVRVTLACFS